MINLLSVTPLLKKRLAKIYTAFSLLGSFLFKDLALKLDFFKPDLKKAHKRLKQGNPKECKEMSQAVVNKKPF